MTTFYICFCDLTGECHAMSSKTDCCEICDGPHVATQENVSRAFVAYQARIREVAERGKAEQDKAAADALEAAERERDELIEPPVTPLAAGEMPDRLFIQIVPDAYHSSIRRWSSKPFAGGIEYHKGVARHATGQRKGGDDE